MLTALTDSSITAISKVIKNKVEHNVYELIQNTVRSEFGNDVSEALVHKITLSTLKQLYIHS